MVSIVAKSFAADQPDRMDHARKIDLFVPGHRSCCAAGCWKFVTQNGNRFNLSWKDGRDGGYVTNAVDSAGDSYPFNYDDKQRLTNSPLAPGR